MTSYLIYAILGLASGAVIGLIGLSIVVGYRGSGVVNLAQGAVAMYVAYVFNDVTTQGRYPQPIPGLTPGFDVGGDGGAPTWVGLALALATAVLLGALMHVLVFRLLRYAPPLARVVASVGILLVLQASIAFRFGTAPISVQSILPTSGSVRIFDTNVPHDRFILTGIAIAVAVLLALAFKFTRFGLATRAAAENEKGAILLGFSPDRQAGVNWVLAAILAGFGGILIAPLTQLTPTGFTLLVIPALAAALVGRFSSFGLTIAAALFIGMAQSEVANLPSRASWFPRLGAQDAVPFILIMIAMFVVGRALPTRGTLTETRLPAAPAPTRRGAAIGAVAATGTLVLLLTLSGGYRLAIINSLIAGVICLSLVVITGYVGQISLFQFALAGVAAFVVAAVERHVSVPLPLALLIGGLSAAVVGLVAGLPALRIRGVNLAVVTLAAGWAIEQFFFKNPTYTGGVHGASVSPPELFGVNLAFSQGDTVGTWQFGTLCLVVFVLLAIGVANVRTAKLGQRMLAVRSNERAAAAAGVNVASTKLFGFVLSAFIAGIGGCLIAYQQTAINASSFTALLSVGILVTAYLGGISTVGGAAVAGTLAAGAFFPFLSERFIFSHAANPVEIESLLRGVLLILVAIMNPEGVAGALRAAPKLLDRLVGRDRVVLASSDADAAHQPTEERRSDKAAASM